MHNGDSWWLGPCPLVLARRILRRDGEPLALTSRQFDLPTLLVERAGQVLSYNRYLTGDDDC